MKNITCLIYIFCFVLVISSCRRDIEIIDYQISENEHFLGVSELGAVDTLLILPYPIELLDRYITFDTIGLIFQSPSFYEYLSINRNREGWKVDTTQCGNILSRLLDQNSFQKDVKKVKKVKNRFSFSERGEVKYLDEEGNTLNIPNRIIKRHKPLWKNADENGWPSIPPRPPLPPISPIELFNLKLELEVDSLHINRKQRIDMFREDLAAACLVDNEMQVVQVIIDKEGNLNKFSVVKNMPRKIELEPSIVACLEHRANEPFNFGILKIIPSAKRWQLSDYQYTLPISK